MMRRLSSGSLFVVSLLPCEHLASTRGPREAINQAVAVSLSITPDLLVTRTTVESRIRFVGTGISQ